MMKRMEVILAVALVIGSNLPSAFAGGGPLALPPILSGYHGRRYKNPKTGGLIDVTLNNYVTTSKFFNSRSPVLQRPDMPNGNHQFIHLTGEHAVADRLFAYPEKGATCGMCLRVYMPQGYKQCANHVSNPFCKGEGSKPYIKYVKAPWAWGAKVKKDKNGFYFTALIIEWFDRTAALPYQLTYPTQGVGPTDLFGDWPVKYKGVPCPVGKHGIELQFLDYSKPIPASSEICNNQFGVPCGGSVIKSPGNPLSYMKLMVTSQRIPVSLVEVFLSNRWVPFKRSGDGYWQPGGTGFAYSAPPLNGKLRVRISCANGTKPKTVSIVPGKALCSYQNPKCYGRQLPGVQC